MRDFELAVSELVANMVEYGDGADMTVCVDADGQQQSNQRFRDYLLSLNIDPHYQVLPGVQHLGDDYYEEGSGLEFLDNHFVSVPEPAAAWTLCLIAAAVIPARRRSGNARLISH